MRNDPLGIHSAPIAIIAQAPTPAQATLVAVAQQQQMGDDIARHDFLHHLTHEVSNTLQADGRINLGHDEHGRVLANSVSPYSKIFWDNIEPGVKPLIEALRAKRYLPYSSCEGHCTRSRRYVGLAFVSPETREAFAKSIEALRLPEVLCRRLDRVANMKHDMEAEDASSPKRSDDFRYYQRKDETDGFNVSFHRRYERYWFLELVIFDVTPPVKNLKTLWKAIKLRVLKKWFWPRVTGRITRAVSQKDFPVYPV